LGTSQARIAYPDKDDSSFVRIMISQTARQWIAPAGIARRLGVSPRVIGALTAWSPAHAPGLACFPPVGMSGNGIESVSPVVASIYPH